MLPLGPSKCTIVLLLGVLLSSPILFLGMLISCDDQRDAGIKVLRFKHFVVFCIVAIVTRKTGGRINVASLICMEQWRAQTEAQGGASGMSEEEEKEKEEAVEEEASRPALLSALPPVPASLTRTTFMRGQRFPCNKPLNKASWRGRSRRHTFFSLRAFRQPPPRMPQRLLARSLCPLNMHPARRLLAL